jgi:hypothetical protein
MHFSLESLQKYYCAIHQDCDDCPLKNTNEYTEERCMVNAIQKLDEETYTNINLLDKEKKEG